MPFASFCRWIYIVWSVPLCRSGALFLFVRARSLWLLFGWGSWAVCLFKVERVFLISWVSSRRSALIRGSQFGIAFSHKVAAKSDFASCCRFEHVVSACLFKALIVMPKKARMRPFAFDYAWCQGWWIEMDASDASRCDRKRPQSSHRLFNVSLMHMLLNASQYIVLFLLLGLSRIPMVAGLTS